VPGGFDDIAAAGLALRPDHCGPLTDASQSLGEVRAAADERHFEVMLPDMVALIGGGEDFALIDEVHADGFEHLRLGEVPDAALGHDGDGHDFHDVLDDPQVGHPGNSTFGPDIGRHPLKSHDGHGPRVLRDLRLLGCGDIHDHPTAEHLGEPDFGLPG